jgi:RNA polymerase sigma-70 factor (ECF subfamily)
MDFTQIYNQYHSKVYRICLGYTNNTEEAKDILQETFISVWQNLDSFRNEVNIGTWIYRIATNRCLRSLEKKKRQTKLNHSIIQEPDLQSDEFKGLRIEFLRKIIGELPELDRIIITLTMEDIKQEDIAQIVGLSHTNVRVRTHRIKQKLLKKFSEYGKF